MSSTNVDIQDKSTISETSGWERQVVDAVRAIRYRSVEVVALYGRVVQIVP
jgi:hypothetical protein